MAFNLSDHRQLPLDSRTPPGGPFLSRCFGLQGFGKAADGKANAKKTEEEDRTLVEELNALSFQERNQIYEELHGVASPLVKETSETIAASLAEMKQIMHGLKRQQRRAYERALFLRPTLEQEDDEYLMFLRSEEYDVAAAAKRMCSFYEYKLDLFGDHKLGKKITLDDMSEKDLEAMKHGFLFRHRKKDQAGRRVVIFDCSEIQYEHWKNLARAQFYQYLALLEDEDVQIRGMVFCARLINLPPDHDYMIETIVKCGPALGSLPWRMVGYHLCYDDPRLKPILSLAYMVGGKALRLRMRQHFGSLLEVTYSLRSFGICEGEPVRSIDNILKAFLTERMVIEAERLRNEERLQKENGLVLTPSCHDVLCGRGQSSWSFVGNLEFAETLVDRQDLYTKGEERLDKTVIALDISYKMRDAGSRFLQRTTDGWKILDYGSETVRSKICQAIRLRVKQTETAKALPFPDDEEICSPHCTPNNHVNHVPKRLRVHQ